MTHTVTALNAPITFRAYSAAQLQLFTEEVSALATDIKVGRLDREFHPTLADNAESLISQLNEFHSSLERWSHELVVKLGSFDKTCGLYLEGESGDEDYKDLWEELEQTIATIEVGSASRRVSLHALPSVESPSTLAAYKAQLEADAAATAINPLHQAPYAELQEKLEAVGRAIALMRQESLDKLKNPAAGGAAPSPESKLPLDKQRILQTAVDIVLKATNFIEHVLELKDLLLTQKSLIKQLAALREEAKAADTALYESLTRRAYLDACVHIERPRQAYIDEVEKVLASLELFCAQQRSPATDARGQVERLLAQADPLAAYLTPLAD